MPSKRTNDSVDRILEELNMQQAQAGLRDSVTDHQVDEILRSVGILSLPDEPLPEETLAFPEGDTLDDLLQKPVSQPAPAPAQPRPYTPVQQPDPQPVQPDARTTRPPEQPLPTVDKTGTQTFSGDTTGTGIIKGFLGKMAPGGDAESLDQGKNEFKRFFGTSVAVVPDENGRLHEPGKKKRSLFGLKHAEDTGAFEPINVTMGGGRAVGQGAALGGHDLGGGQRRDKSQLPQHILCPADAAERLAAHKAEYLIDIQLPGNGGGRDIDKWILPHIALALDGIGGDPVTGHLRQKRAGHALDAEGKGHVFHRTLMAEAVQHFYKLFGTLLRDGFPQGFHIGV